MRQRQILALGLAGCILSGVGISLTFAYFFGQEKAVSADAVGKVQLEVCMLESGEEYAEDRVTGILPGQTIDRRPAVILDGESPDAYIRVRIEFGGVLEKTGSESEEEQEERVARIRDLRDGIDFCDGWLEGEDGFYYYQKKVIHSSIVPVYDGVTIPESWDNEIAEKTFTIELSAEAVRADCLDPWMENGNEEILSWD